VAIFRFTGNVVPQRVRFGVIQREQPIIQTRVGEVVQLAIDRRNQTGPAIAGGSKRRHPIFVTGSTLRDMVVDHLLRN